MIEFYDVSCWQSPDAVASLVHRNGDKILCVKASEGATLKDGKAGAHVNACKNDVECFMFYHFMRCDKNAPNIAVEVENFCDAVKIIRDKTGIKKAVYALDFERCDNKHKYSDAANPLHRAALERAIKLLEVRNGIAPYVYACESEYKMLKACNVYIPWAWVAKYSMLPPVEPWGIWQYTNTRGVIDRNKYRSTLDAFKRKAATIQ